MKTTLSRRNWFKSSLVLGTGLAFTPALIDSLMAAPVSEAERMHNLTSFAPGQLPSSQSLRRDSAQIDFVAHNA